MQNDKVKLKIGLRQSGRRLNFGVLLAVSVFVLVFASGLAITQTVFAGVDQNGDGSIDPYEACLGSAVGASCNGALYGLCGGAKGALGTGCYASPAVCKDGVWGGAGLPACVATKLCPDTDGDGRGKCRIYGDSPPSSEYSFESRPGDCDDSDIWSHSYASANIQSISVDFDPDYVAWAKSVRQYTPTKPYSLRDTIKTTATFKQKCGLKTPTPEMLSMGVFIVLGDGREILISEGLSKKTDFVYNISVDLQSMMTEDLIAAIAKNPSWRIKLVGPDILSNKNAPAWSQPDTPKKDTPQYASLPMKNYVKKLIIIGGFGAPARHKIFSTLGSLASGAIKIPLRLKSVARNTIKIREEINKQLTEGNEVLVVGHSLGAVIAYNLQKEFAAANKCVSGVYIDPPYDFSLCKIPLVNLIPAIASFKKACEGIDSDSNTINWTNGKGLLHFFAHDAFTFPNYVYNNQTGRQRVEGLIKVVKGRLGGSFSACSFGTVPPPASIKTTPTITSISSSSVRPGDSVTITGSGFSPNGNIVDIQHATYAQVYYELFNLPSSNGTTLTFVLPPSPVPPIQTTPGKYFLKVSAVGSDWSNALTVQVAK